MRSFLHTISITAAICTAPVLLSDANVFAFPSDLSREPLPFAVSPLDTVEVRIDNSVVFQTISGFGSSIRSLVFPTGDNVPADLRQQAIDSVYGDVGLNLGFLELGLIETPENAVDPWQLRANDNQDPFLINPTGFNWDGTSAAWAKIVVPAAPYGFDDYSISRLINLSALDFLQVLREQDYERYLDEAAEHVVAVLSYWRDTYGVVPKTLAPFNEPTSGNRELAGERPASEIVDLVKRIGARMDDAGFGDVGFVVPNEETLSRSTVVARAILSDPEARKYVAAIGYHPYPYGSAYASPSRILAESGTGNPNPDAVERRLELAELAAQYDVAAWMSEVSQGPGNADFPFGSFQNVRARAVHIHDELTYANAAAFFGMLALWDSKSHEEHFLGAVDFYSEQSHIALIDNDAGTVNLTGMGYAIGHYARWIPPGAVRIESESGDARLKVTAFRDDANERLIFVLINNHPTAQTVRLGLDGVTVGSNVSGEVSDASARWVPLESLTSVSPSSVILDMPGESVMSISIPATTDLSSDFPAPESDHLVLHPSIPNPFRSSATISFELSRSDDIRLDLLDPAGRSVRMLANNRFPGGVHTVRLDGASLVSGVYLIRLQNDRSIRTQTAVHIR